MKKAELVQLVEHVDKSRTECDGATRLIHLALHRAGVHHTIYFGNVMDKQGKILISNHYWVRVRRFIIDYRARMWAGPDAAHGVFCQPEQPDFIYRGVSTMLDLSSCLVVEQFENMPELELAEKAFMEGFLAETSATA